MNVNEEKSIFKDDRPPNIIGMDGEPITLSILVAS